MLLTTILSVSAYSDNHSNVPAGSGAFVALMAQAQDADAYVKTLKKNPAPFEAIGSSVAGACIKKTGNDSPSQMFIYNAFDSVEQAMAATDK